MFETAGLTGATTREIARIAAVNEVTLDRHFQNKEQLLAAVITEAIALQAQALADHDDWTQNLYIDLKNYARLCNQMIEEHEDLIRIFIGEAKRHPQPARLILIGNRQIAARTTSCVHKEGSRERRSVLRYRFESIYGEFYGYVA